MTMLNETARKASVSLLDELVDRVSFWTKFVRIVAYILRFARHKRISGSHLKKPAKHAHFAFDVLRKHFNISVNY